MTGLFLIFFAVSSFSCSKNGKNTNSPEGITQKPEIVIHEAEAGTETNRDMYYRFLTAVQNAELPDSLAVNLRKAWETGSAFYAELQKILQGDKHLRELVDKQHPLSADYTPADLVTLENGHYRVGRTGLNLRKAAAAALDEMAATAATGGVTLIASSTYRSYSYQAEVYSRVVREMGQAAADRESARPGCSQHQTGLTVDFGSIDDSFAATAASRWMTVNASRFGWSLSFLYGYEAVTGYRWESWHYRYVGRDLAAFIDAYFNGIQQYTLRFLYEWEQLTPGKLALPACW
jgi:D-alanyl-D-alanine carboxypeptidase